jgi:mono/diheme cytochrome c family protein
MEGPTNRVKFNARDDDAEYPDGLWLERADGRLYDAAEGGNAAFENLADMAFADASDNGKQDYAVAQPPDDADTLLAQRAFMRDQVCGQCHSTNFADEQLLIADLIHENTKTIQNEAFDIVRAMAIVANLHVNVDQRPGNPETGTTGLYGANMVLRNLDTIETIYFELMKYDNVKTWKGAYHQNPDYTHWYGWSTLVMHLDDIGAEATDLVLTDMWMNGVAYPGETGDLVEDRLYQGVIFDSGSLTNLYDKFPGPGDDGAELPIDVDGDGVPEFTPVEGSPGTFTYDGGEITFH